VKTAFYLARSISIVCGIVVTFVSCAYPEGLSSLIEVAKSQGEIQKEYAEETRAYEAVKRAVENGALKKGAAKETVMKSYGDPVVMLPVSVSEKRERWLYKPASSDFLGAGPKINLYFDGNGALDEIASTDSAKK
jgi:hypothetical protein